MNRSDRPSFWSGFMTNRWNLLTTVIGFFILALIASLGCFKLVTQNRATRSGWESMIRWMQATQGLPDLGKSEPMILDYLAKYYAPQETGRRANLDLTQVKWYILDIEN